MDSALAIAIRELFDDGTLAMERTAEEMQELLQDVPVFQNGLGRDFVQANLDELNELSVSEVLAGHVFPSRKAMAEKLADPAEEQRFAHLYTGPGFTDGVHTSQQRLLDLSVEERAAKVIHVARAFSGGAQDAGTD